MSSVQVPSATLVLDYWSRVELLQGDRDHRRIYGVRVNAEGDRRRERSCKKRFTATRSNLARFERIRSPAPARGPT